MNTDSGSGQVVKRLICEEFRKDDKYECDIADIRESEKIQITLPDGGIRRCESLTFRINLLTGVLTVYCFNYPIDERYWVEKDYIYTISAEQFCEYANIFNMDPALKQMRTKRDWEDILNCAEVQEMIADKKERELEIEKQYAIRIPRNIIKRTPSMDYSFNISLYQKFGDSYALLTCEDNKYYIKIPDKVRELTVDESIWIEKYIRRVIVSPNMKIFQSYHGGDNMCVSIKRRGKVVGNDFSGGPYMKYCKLLHKAQKLARYGSIPMDGPTVWLRKMFQKL